MRGRRLSPMGMLLVLLVSSLVAICTSAFIDFKVRAQCMEFGFTEVRYGYSAWCTKRVNGTDILARLDTLRGRR
jgi:hypothetical protein